MPGNRLVAWLVGNAVHQVVKLAFRLWFCYQADHDCHEEACGPREYGNPEVLSHSRGKLMQRGDPASLRLSYRESVSRGCGSRSKQKAGKRRVAGSALPKHSEQKGGKQGRIYEAKHQLKEIHDVVE